MTSAAAPDHATGHAGAGRPGPNGAGGVSLSPEAPWRWLSRAWDDYKKVPVLCAGYGLLFVLAGYAVLWGLSATGLTAAMPVAVGAFALVGPLMATGLYAIARSLEQGQRPRFTETVFVRAASPSQIAYLGVFLLVGLFVWTVVAFALFAMFVAGQVVSPQGFTAFALGTPRGLAMITIGTIAGGLIAFAIFAGAAFSIPMLVDRRLDFATAMGASITAVRSSPRAMILWAWIIAGSIVLGAATLLLGFVVLFPLLGLATWHGYREAFPS